MNLKETDTINGIDVEMFDIESLPNIEPKQNLTQSTKRKTNSNESKARKRPILFHRNEYLAVRNEEGSFFLCICLSNIYECSKKWPIRWLDKVQNSDDIYLLSYCDKIHLSCILTSVELNKMNGTYQLKQMERERIENVLKDSLDVASDLSSQSGEELSTTSYTTSPENIVRDEVKQDILLQGCQNHAQDVQGHDVQDEQVIQDISSESQSQITREYVFPKQAIAIQNTGLNDDSNQRNAIQDDQTIQREFNQDIHENCGSQHVADEVRQEEIQTGDEQIIREEESFSSSISETLNSSAPQYLSNDSQTIDDEEQPIKKKRGAAKEWIIVQTFEDPKLADEHISQLTDFSLYYKHRTQNGLQKYLRCNRVPLRGKQCAASYQIMYNNNTTVTILKSASEHNHGENTARKYTKIQENTKLEINNLIEMHMKPKAILSSLRTKPDVVVPSLKQLYGYMAREKKGTNRISLGELEKWLVDRIAIPDDEHEVFVVNYEVNYDEPNFRFFLSTKNLLRQSLKSKIVHSDTTYKLNWEGFPNLVAGVTDLDRHFHKSGIGVCMDEKTEDFSFIFRSLSTGIYRVVGECFEPTTLVADAAKAIFNGFEAVFGTCLIIMCWAHVKRAVKKRFKKSSVSKENQVDILMDLDKLQESPSVEMFKKGVDVELFFEKWKMEKDFIDYFRDQWINDNVNWFEGIRQFTPKTDNALEGANKWIKDLHTNRERLPLAQFLESLLKMVKDWSDDYIQDKVFVSESTIELPMWTESYQWVKLEKRVLTTKEGDCLVCKVPATGMDSVIELPTYQYHTFQDFVKYAFAVYYVRMPLNNWRSGTCTCPCFFKRFLCKHLVGLAMRYNLTQPPLEAKQVPLGQKRKRGRPRKAKNALVVD